MNIESQYLVKDPAATGFLDTAQLDTPSGTTSPEGRTPSL